MSWLTRQHRDIRPNIRLMDINIRLRCIYWPLNQWFTIWRLRFPWLGHFHHFPACNRCFHFNGNDMCTTNTTTIQRAGRIRAIIAWPRCNVLQWKTVSASLGHTVTHQCLVLWSLKWFILSTMIRIEWTSHTHTHKLNKLSFIQVEVQFEWKHNASRSAAHMHDGQFDGGQRN